MTVRDFYKWAKKNDCVDFEVEIQYRDEGGCYNGTADLEESEITINRSNISRYSGILVI